MTSPDLPNPLDTLDMPDRLRRHLLLLPAAQYLPLDLELDYLTFVLTYFYDSSLSFTVLYYLVSVLLPALLCYRNVFCLPCEPSWLVFPPW